MPLLCIQNCKQFSWHGTFPSYLVCSCFLFHLKISVVWNSSHDFHVSFMSLDLQLVKSCSKVRGLRWTRFTDGIWVWLFHHDGGLGQNWGSNLLHCETSWFSVLESPAAWQSSSWPVGWRDLLYRPSGNVGGSSCVGSQRWPGSLSVWRLAAAPSVPAAVDDVRSVCVHVWGSDRVLYWRWGSGF